jgi:hypothetical protein
VTDVDDGIYKDLPLSKEWRKALKSCMSVADRPVLAAQLVEHALWADFDRESLRQVIATITRERVAYQGELPGLDNPEVAPNATRMLPMRGAFQNVLCGHLDDYMDDHWTATTEIAESAVTGAFREWLGQRQRQIEAHIVIRDPTASALREAVRQVCGEVDCAGLARKACNQKRPGRMPRRSRVQLDEDLMAPR